MRFKINLQIIFTVIFLDQFTKFLAPNLGLTVVKNTGIAFGLFPNFAWGIVIFLLMMGFLFRAPILIGARKKPTPEKKPLKEKFSILHFEEIFGEAKHFQFLISLILGGGLSNLVDRLFLGYIRDFIDLKIWPVFNLADAAITLGVFSILLAQVRTSTN